MLEIVTGGALAVAAGLNAYIPILAIALLARFTELISLPATWAWLENGWVIGVLAVLFVVEALVDKFPVLDTVNDVLQTVIRPASGGLAFSIGVSSDTVAVADPEAFVQSGQLWPFLIGVGVALVPHLLKSLVRPILNLFTAGAGAALTSTLEDLGALVITVLAIVVPLLALVFVLVVMVLLVRRLVRARAARAARAAPHSAPSA